MVISIRQMVEWSLHDGFDGSAANHRPNIIKSDGELARLFDHLGVALVHKQKCIDLEDSDQLSQSKNRMKCLRKRRTTY